MSRQMKTKLLSLSRKTQPTPPENEDKGNIAILEEEKARVARLELALNSPIARPSRQCSTPIDNNGETGEDTADRDSAGSPISMFFCTQESVGEVAWDWNGGKETGSKNGMSNITPKRRRSMKKKRLAKGNSPLMNLPLKRKITRSDNVERINKFAEEFQALADKIKSERVIKTEKRSEGSGDISDMKTQMVKERKDDIHEAETLKVNTEETDASLHDLFDDSIDACMVRCSQEIEDKLRLESAENSANKDKEEEDKEESDQRREEIPASQIPDDSLDDCLALCFDDDTDLASEFLEPRKRREEGAKKCSWNIGEDLSRMKKPAETSPCFKRKQQCMSSDVLPSTQSRKFFKSKSLSDSMCGKSSNEKARRSILNLNVNSKTNLGKNSSPLSKCSSNINLSSRIKTNDDLPFQKLPNLVSSAGSRNDLSSGSSTITNPCNSHVSYSYLRNVGKDSALQKVELNGDKKFEKEKSTIDFKISQPRCTPAEIERKRTEARMKLEANRLKKQLIFDRSNLTAAKRPIVKR